METAREAFIKGLKAYEQQDYDKAILYFTQALELDTRHAQAYCRRGMAYLHNGNCEKALRDCTKSLEIDPNNAYVYYVRGGVRSVKDDYDHAIEDFTKAIELDSHDPAPFSSRGHAYYNKNDYPKALEDFDKALAINPKYTRALLGRGLVYATLDKYAQALQDFDQAIDIDPWCSDLYACRAIIRYADDDIIKASWDMQEVHKLGGGFDPHLLKKLIDRLSPKIKAVSVGVYSYNGVSNAQDGNYAEAIANFTMAIEIDPEAAKKNFVYQNRANAYCSAGDYDQAIRECDRIIEEVEPDSYYALTLRGNAHHRKQEYDQAIADFNKAIEIDPVCIWAYICRGREFNAKGDFTKAIADLTKAIEKDANMSKQNGAYPLRGYAYYRIKDYAAALRDYDKALESDPERAYRRQSTYAPIHFERGCVYDAMGDYAHAIEDYMKAIELDSGYAQAYRNLADAIRRFSNLGQAVADFAKTHEKEIHAYCKKADFNLADLRETKDRNTAIIPPTEKPSKQSTWRDRLKALLRLR